MVQSYGGIACIDFLHIGAGSLGELSPSARRSVEKFRSALERLLTSEARGAGVADADLAVLNGVIERATRLRGLVPTVRGYGWSWLAEPDPVTGVLFAPAWSAAQLLAGEDRHRLKCCDGCGRLFFDRSRNRSRRWCDMEGCGNRAKVRRHRQKAGG